MEQSTFEGCPASPFTLYRLIMREKAEKVALNILRELTAGAELETIGNTLLKSRVYSTLAISVGYFCLTFLPWRTISDSS